MFVRDRREVTALARPGIGHDGAMDIGQLIQLVGGLFLLGSGVRQARHIPLLRRRGLRASGSVVRVRQEWDAEENVQLYAPVVSFVDEHGTRREFTTETMTTWTTHQPGQAVSVLYPPGRPEAARLKSGAHSAVWSVGAGMSAVFIVVGVVLLVLFVRGLR